MRSSRIGALLGTVTLAIILLAAVFLSSFFITYEEILLNHNETSVPTGLPSKHVVEYVKPLKMRPPLHERDVLYPEEDSRHQGTNHHSGHFRERMAEIWDPHPEYEFTGFGRRFHLQLAQSQAPFVVPGIKVMHVWENLTVVEEPKLRPEGCFYTGRVKGDPQSLVSVNLCHGMTGHIRTSNGSYLIEPAEPWKDHSTPIKHALEKLPSQQMQGFDFSSESSERSTRKKRSLSKEYYVELMVVADREMVNYHGAALEGYILNLMSIAAMIFKDASIGNHISIAVVKLFYIKDIDFSKRSPNENGSSASTMLRNFCEWQSNHNSPDDSSTRHHDSALLLTRENICRDHRHVHQPDKCDTLGLAELGTMCESSSCALVRDIGLSAGFTIAHELGHVLNMPHDDDYKCSPYKGKEEKSYVMSRMLDHDTYPWAWSNCSRHFLTEFLDAGSGDCLLDPPFEDKLPDRFGAEGQFPGEVFNENKQCELVFGKRSKICPFMPVCKRLWCTSEKGNQSQGCKSLHLPWADGTPCGDHQWCQRGHCVPRDRESLYPIDGGWGPWQRFGECSRTCGGGIRKSVRPCNNPPPANGGHYCVGQRIRYQSCATNECPSEAQDFREQQCAKFNNNNFKIQGLAEDVKWLPKYGGISTEDRCKLYCRVAKSSAYYLLKDKVIDGTVCGPDTYDVCVNGACLPAGCDHELNSTTDLDYCGQCGGNNSTCEQKAGKYNEARYGYTPVVRIPAGSSNIEIKQYSNNDHHDDNYLALVDVDTSQYILNGNYVVSHQKRILYGGTTLEYSGSDGIVERINASRPLTKDLIVEVLSVGKVLPPKIEYVYTVQKSFNKYTWELANHWTICDKVCHGRSWRDYKCVKVKAGEEVAKELCDHLSRPTRMEMPCNTNCDLEWEVYSRSECSSHCGPGEKTLSFKCYKNQIDEFGNNQKSIQHETVCSHSPKPSDTEYCEGPCYSIGWDYGPWSTCSQTCGKGIKTRRADCLDGAKRIRDDRECDISERNTEEVCEVKPCPQWEVKEWSECSQTCGRGTRRRPYSCKEGRKDVASSLCEGTPPKYEEECNLEPCPQWIEVGNWSECSKNCGIGEQSIMIECTVPEGCNSLPKPHTTRSCHIRPCSLHHENAVPDDTNSPSHYVLEQKPGKCIPSSSSSCGPGKRTIIYQCFDKYYKKFVDLSACPKYRVFHYTPKYEACNIPCGEWRVKDWEPCPAVCGEGTETRQVYCVEDGRKVPDNHCPKYSKPAYERACKQSCSEEGDKDEWSIGDWSKCSASCGIGVQRRRVFCPGSCLEPMPEIQQSCTGQMCFEEGSWFATGWLPCNVTCGTGIQNSEYKCKISSHGSILPDEACRKEKPKHVISCYAGECSQDDSDKPKWKTSKWTACSLDNCRKNRTVICMHGKQPQDDNVCFKKLKRKKPKTVRICKRRMCQGHHPFVWRAGKWSECSVTCGKGIKKRNVYCPQRQKEHNCQGSKPNSVATCFQECKHSRLNDNYFWKPGPWKPCIDHCSLNGQKRELKCIKGNTEVPKKRCLKIPKPPRWKKCDELKCPSCAELYKILGTKQNMIDEYYSIYPRGLDRELQVLCYGMGSGIPREYIKVDHRQNFAVNYHPEVKRPSCHSSSDMCYNDAYENNNFHSGFTTFNMIAINATTMTVIANDLKFAMTVRGSPVRYGEAGDCYSNSCPQGHFKVSLEGTGLRISRNTSWSKSSGTKMEISRSDDHTWVEAKCGGCCGRCWPTYGIKLDLAPP